MNRLLGVVAGVDDDAIAGFIDAFDFRDLFHGVEKMAHKVVWQTVANVGEVSVCTGIWGSRSSNAITLSSSYTTLAGISPAAILQNTQSVICHAAFLAQCAH